MQNILLVPKDIKTADRAVEQNSLCIPVECGVAPAHSGCQSDPSCGSSLEITVLTSTSKI